MITRLVCLCATAVVTGLLLGCGSSGWNSELAQEIGLVDPAGPKPESETTQFYLSIHNVSPQRDGEVYRMPIQYAPGRVVYMQPSAMITSRYITSADVFTVKDGFGIICYLDGRGSMLWEQLSVAYRGEKLALLIDGEFRAFIEIREFSQQSAFTLDGPFTQEEAAGIARYAAYNTGHNMGESLGN